ncbi:uncharacterized protein LOC110044940 [Orbicella faveolata]|uniref:uncharacterized protein LOC110044940 n=1 Tax=Orbicella faveolata TaxID=48498 RepID=UPI0009E2B82C|nr:uncharacterized protein LOC110044940 [Orbicella faveolata]
MLWLTFLNWILILFLITPAVVNYWRGTWYILDLFVFPNDEVLSAWVTVTASFGAIFLIMLVEDYIKEFLDEKKARKGLYLVLFYPLAFLSVTSWRGLWMMLDLYTTTALTSAIVSHVVGFFIVLALKTTYSLIAIPGYCISERHIDPPEKILQVKKCFRTKTSARMLNSFVTVFIIGAAVISYWRGTWLIIVAAVQPLNDKLSSSIALIILSYSVLSWCYFLSTCLSTVNINPPYSALSRSLEQVFVYILGFGVVASWIGIWHLMDIYLLPDLPIASALVGHFAGIVVLYLLQGGLNLVSPPATCRIPNKEILEGLDLGNYLKRGSEKEIIRQTRTTV